MTTADLKRLCKLWQKRLRITDWSVQIAFAAKEEMADLGQTLYDPRNMTAITQINPAEAEHGADGIEPTIIHELLHVVLHGDKEYRKEDIMQERGINQVADALYRAYRRKRT